jgi:hypothetical protein
VKHHRGVEAGLGALLQPTAEGDKRIAAAKQYTRQDATGRFAQPGLRQQAVSMAFPYACFLVSPGKLNHPITSIHDGLLWHLLWSIHTVLVQISTHILIKSREVFNTLS